MLSGVIMNNEKQTEGWVHAGQHKKTALVINRLSRNEGHVRAIKRMLEEDNPCPDVLIQLAAVKAAVQKASQIVLEDHIESCLGEAAIKGKSEQEWQRLKEALDKYIH
jgi:CsoR family transcriptional regulator, copper-sensing transcriptional repressor